MKKLRIEYDEVNQIENGLGEMVERGLIQLITYTFYVYVGDDEDYVWVQSFSDITEGYNRCLEWFNSFYTFTPRDERDVMRLFYIGTDYRGRPMYRNAGGDLFKNVNLVKDKVEGLCTVYGGFDGLPATPLEYSRFKNYIIKFGVD